MTDEMSNEERAKMDKLGRDWMARVQASKKYEEDWVDTAQRAEKAYLVDFDGNVPPAFNILHSNVETIVPAIYNSTPAPDIRPRHANKDDLAKLVCDILERAIATQIDDSNLDIEMEKTAQDAFLAGRGVTRLRYEADMQGEILQGERVMIENVSWRDYREGQAQRWSEVPWVAFRYHVFASELERMRGGEDYSEVVSGDDYEDGKRGGVDIWQVWDKETRRVITISADDNKVVSVADDPLGLPGFFPMPEPTQPITGSGKRCPVCPYAVYETLAKELDTQTKRINAITRGLKVRGIFAGDSDLMDALAQVEDNSILSVPDLKGAAATTKLDDMISWWPIDKAITVIRELIIQREQTKQAIYEITGISDIVRGQSSTQATATEQEIKNRWGSQRIKKMQNMVARHVRDLFVLSAEVMAKNFDPQSILKASGVPLDPEQSMQVIPMLQQVDHYRIDIESDSTVRADLTQKRTEMAEFLQGTSQFFSTMSPIIEQAPQVAQPLAEMYGAFARQFSLGKQAEDSIDQMIEMAKQAQPGQQDKPDPVEMARVKLDERRLQFEEQKEQRDFIIRQAEVKIAAQEAGVKVGDLNVKQFTAQKDAQHREAEIAIEVSQERPVAIGNG